MEKVMSRSDIENVKMDSHIMTDEGRWPELRALFFAGAALGIASHDGTEAAVASVTKLVLEALRP